MYQASVRNRGWVREVRPNNVQYDKTRDDIRRQKALFVVEDTRGGEGEKENGSRKEGREEGEKKG